MKISIKLTMLALLGIFIISSCGKDQNQREINEYVSAFLKNNDSIVMFGALDINAIINKTNYTKESKIKALISGQLKEFRSGIEEKSPIYFALQGPITSDKNSSSTYLFLDVKNEDSLITSLQQNGYSFAKVGDYKVHTDDDVTIGIKKDIAVVILQKEGMNGKSALKKVFEKSKGELAGGKIDEILSQKGDILIGTNLNSLYMTSNTDLGDLPTERKKELEAMVKDSYIQTAFLFEKGSATIESKHMFNEDLKKRLIFIADNKADILTNLGNGMPNAGLSLNLDLEKLENLINDYSPKTIDKLATAMNIDPMMMKLVGGNNLLSTLSDGKMGGLFFMDQENYGFGINAYLGLKDMGKNLFPFVEPKIKVEFTYDYIQSGVRAYTLQNFANVPNGKIKLPNGCEVFGTKGLTAFLFLKDLPMDEFGLSDQYAILNTVDYLTFELDENGSKLYIKAKNEKINFLEQAFDVYLELAMSKMGGMAI